MKEQLIFKHAHIETKDGHFLGYASVFNVEDLHGDVIMPNAFAGNDISNVKLLWQHNAAEPIGKVINLIQTKHGLVIEAQILTTTRQGADIVQMINEGVIDGLSIGFEIIEAEKFEGKRFITKLKLWEVSIVTFPANPEARIANSNEEDATKTLKEAIAKVKATLA